MAWPVLMSDEFISINPFVAHLTSKAIDVPKSVKRAVEFIINWQKTVSTSWFIMCPTLFTRGSVWRSFHFAIFLECILTNATLKTFRMIFIAKYLYGFSLYFFLTPVTTIFYTVKFFLIAFITIKLILVVQSLWLGLVNTTKLTVIMVLMIVFIHRGNFYDFWIVDEFLTVRTYQDWWFFLYIRI